MWINISACVFVWPNSQEQAKRSWKDVRGGLVNHLLTDYHPSGCWFYPWGTAVLLRFLFLLCRVNISNQLSRNVKLRCWINTYEFSCYASRRCLCDPLSAPPTSLVTPVHPSTSLCTLPHFCILLVWIAGLINFLQEAPVSPVRWIFHGSQTVFEKKASQTLMDGLWVTAADERNPLFLSRGLHHHCHSHCAANVSCAHYMILFIWFCYRENWLKWLLLGIFIRRP